MEFDQILEKMGEIDVNLATRFAPLEKFVKENGGMQLRDDVMALRDQYDELKKFVSAISLKKGEMAAAPVNKSTFENFGTFMDAIVGRSGPAMRLLESRGVFEKGMAEGTTSTGGALVPEALHNEIISLLPTYSKFRKNAYVIPTVSDNDKWPKINSDVTIYSPGEAGSITDSVPAFSNVGLPPTKLAGLVKASTEVSEDAVASVGAIRGESMIRAIGKAEDECGFLGDGTSTYHGFVGIAGAFMNNHGSYGSQTASAANGGLVCAAGNTWAEITMANFRTVVSVLPEQFDDNSKWYCSKRFFWEVMWPNLVAESGGLATIGHPGFIERRPNYTFLGYPVEMVSVMPSSEANDQICCILGDLSMGAYLGDRRALTIDEDRSVYFATDEIGIRCTERIGINVFGWGSSTEAGPICALTTFNS